MSLLVCIILIQHNPSFSSPKVWSFSCDLSQRKLKFFYLVKTFKSVFSHWLSLYTCIVGLVQLFKSNLQFNIKLYLIGLSPDLKKKGFINNLCYIQEHFLVME